jgi:hypothetical protein
LGILDDKILGDFYTIIKRSRQRIRTTTIWRTTKDK